MPSRPPQHRAAGWRPYKEPAKQVRRRQARRALPTNSARWRKIREAQLAREPLCRCCAALNIVREATDVDHINGDDSDHRDCNLQSLCGSCHSRKTARETAGSGASRGTGPSSTTRKVTHRNLNGQGGGGSKSDPNVSRYARPPFLAFPQNLNLRGNPDGSAQAARGLGQAEGG